MMIQLNPQIPVLTPKGPGVAIFLIDYSAEHDLHWTVFPDESGECWTFSNREIRAQKNITAGRKHVQDPRTEPRKNLAVAAGPNFGATT